MQRTAYLTLTSIEGVEEATSLGDKGIKYLAVEATLESAPHGLMNGVTTVRAPIEEQDKFKIGDIYLYEVDDKNNISITKVEDE